MRSSGIAVLLPIFVREELWEKFLPRGVSFWVGKGVFRTKVLFMHFLCFVPHRLVFVGQGGVFFYFHFDHSFCLRHSSVSPVSLGIIVREGRGTLSSISRSYLCGVRPI